MNLPYKSIGITSSLPYKVLHHHVLIQINYLSFKEQCSRGEVPLTQFLQSFLQRVGGITKGVVSLERVLLLFKLAIV